MARRLLHISGSTRIERNDMTARIADAITLSDAWLVDFAMFANISTMFRVALPARNLHAFGRRLRGTGLTLDERSEQVLSAWAAEAPDGEITATLQISYVRAEAEMPRAVPAFAR